MEAELTALVYALKDINQTLIGIGVTLAVFFLFWVLRG